MKIETIKTQKVKIYEDLNKIITQNISNLEERSIVVFTSKIISLSQGRVAKKGANKVELIKNEADYYLEGDRPYGKILTIKDSIIIPDAGIDESNSDKQIVLWPQKPQETANEIRSFLKKAFELKEVGVIITDSKTTPLRWGTTGVAVAFSGFRALNDYIGKKDIFDREMEMTKANVLDGLAAAAVLTMGEGNEQTPIAVITDLPFVQFSDSDPSKQEIDSINIAITEDIYSPIIRIEEWKR
jgi:putative folate metabolism gamma-glutamate ligase